MIGESNMIKFRYRGNFKFSTFILITFFSINLIFSFPSFFLEGVAEQRAFDAEVFNENISIPSGSFKTADFNLQEGEEFEIIYTLQVKENLPINIWLVNEDNYLLLISDVNFLYYIDGSDQEVSYTKKIVSFKEEGIYKLVMINTNNRTVNVNIISEIRIYSSDSGETSPEDLSFFFYPLVIAVIILVGLLVALLFKVRKYKQALPKVSKKASFKKKDKKRRTTDQVSDKEFTKKLKKHKVKKTKPKVSDNESSQYLENIVPKKNDPEVTEKVSPSFCGDCGKPINTQFCPYCGKKTEL
jgi:hypothetical protein